MVKIHLLLYATKKSDSEAPPQTDWQGNIQETYSYGEGAAKCVINFRW